MRKLTIDNGKIPNNRHKMMLIDQMGNSIFRTKDRKFINEHCSKLTAKKIGYAYSNRSWVKDAESVVLINDNRQEVSVMGDRGFVTTSLVLEEFLQRNRGHQEYENERNKFFTQDESMLDSTSYIGKLYTLDLMWHMIEQDVDAIEIKSHSKDEETPHVFQSQRYASLADESMKKLRDDFTRVTSERFAEFYKELKEKGKADYKDTEFYIGDLDCRKYDNGWYALKEYYNECMKRTSNNEDILQFDEWLTIYIEQKLDENPIDPIMFLMEHFGMSKHSEEVRDVLSVVSGYYSGTEPRVVAETKFKRNNDWTLDYNNLIKAETMKLRLALQGETFID
mgnify:CR=1 FL=1